MIVGSAIGFGYGELVETLIDGWRWPFIIESLIMLPILSLCFLAYKDPVFCSKKKAVSLEPDGGSEQEPEKLTLMQQLEKLAHLRVFVLISAGYGAYAFTVGGLSFWGPDFQEKYYHASSTVATLTLGAITILCGFSATFVGSTYMDLRLKLPQKSFEDGILSNQGLLNKRAEEATRIIFYSITAAGIAGVVSAIPAIYPIWIVGVVFAEFFIFM
jgi:hypothetical protein